MELGRVGVWSSQLVTMPAAATKTAVAEVEALGFRTVWYPESLAKEAMSVAGFLLGASDRLIVATGIANMWVRDPVAMINGARTLAEAFSDRFLLGIGVSHGPSVNRRGHDYRRPLSAMVSYLAAIDDAPYQGPAPAEEPPMVLAALGPRMLRLAADRTWGAHPYFVPVEHTAFARSEMGSEALLAPEQAVVVSSDPSEARRIARIHTRRYLAIEHYRNNLLRLGWDEGDVAGDGSDALVDAIVVWGDVTAIQVRVAAHFEAGADHVCVQVLNGTGDLFPSDDLKKIAPALLEL